MLEKSETNNAIVTQLTNVRPHPNADRLKLATVLGTPVVVGLDSKDGDLVIYFDSNLRLSHEYLYNNNLYSNKEMNKDTSVRGYFGKNGRVRAQKFRGEISNGYVAEFESLFFICEVHWILKEGDEFTSINGVKICEKYIVPIKGFQGQSRKQTKPISTMFHKHWDTKQLMRELNSIPSFTTCYIEEKIHGTSGRTGNVLCKTNRPWWKFWKPKEEWKVISGTRRVDEINYHLPQIRKEIEDKISPHLHKGEEVYYEIYGYDKTGSPIQVGFPYGCNPREYKVLIYRVTITTPDGFCFDLDRESVYRRANELGLEKPILFAVCGGHDILSQAKRFYSGKSAVDANTVKEGIVVWFKDSCNKWTCLKYKSEEFLLTQDELTEKEQGDIEDML